MPVPQETASWPGSPVTHVSCAGGPRASEPGGTVSTWAKTQAAPGCRGARATRGRNGKLAGAELAPSFCRTAGPPGAQPGLHTWDSARLRSLFSTGSPKMRQRPPPRRDMTIVSGPWSVAVGVPPGPPGPRPVRSSLPIHTAAWWHRPCSKWRGRSRQGRRLPRVLCPCAPLLKPTALPPSSRGPGSGEAGWHPWCLLRFYSTF